MPYIDAKIDLRLELIKKDEDKYLKDRKRPRDTELEEKWSKA